MGQDQRDGSRTLASLMDEVDSDTLRRVPIVMIRRESFDLCFPVEMVSPVLADLLQKA